MKNEVLCIVASIDDLPYLKKKWGDKICKARKEKIERLSGELDKQRSLLAEYVLYEALAVMMPSFKPPCRWQADSKGKLELIDYPKLNCNLSHDGKYACVALSDSPVGIDIAKPHPVPSRLAMKIMTPSELEQYSNASDKQEAFFACWTRKESFQKLLGEGFYRPMSTFETADKIFYEERIEDYFLCISTHGEANVIRWKIGDPA
ncbi:MAG: 4'-phosphopantetheinyl transferase superfamily protein [Eubacteriales bacterium]|nr:4'-phosphopantetheinyl transferase superfamily protein [Eubacteriales bacterium]